MDTATKTVVFRLSYCGYALNSVDYPTRAAATKALKQPRYAGYKGAYVVQRTVGGR